ncbi:UNVERIFIED_CONTAM: hypothetical protein FKN15_024497 [Acipenser sinensis]
MVSCVGQTTPPVAGPGRENVVFFVFAPVQNSYILGLDFMSTGPPSRTPAVPVGTSTHYGSTAGTSQTPGEALQGEKPTCQPPAASSWAQLLWCLNRGTQPTPQGIPMGAVGPQQPAASSNQHSWSPRSSRQPPTIDNRAQLL